jgi:hypothetical protein
MANNTDFTLNKDAYTSFDALTLKQLIKQRLNDGGVFTDQIFEGSNISAIIDIIAYSYHSLLFYLNQTGSESLFSEATLYENMNRIVKLIDYKPNGFQTSLLPFQVEANSNIEPNLYTLKRYSYIILNGIYYSFKDDITFNKTETGRQTLQDFSDDNLLHQGQYFEYPAQLGIGEDFETVTLVIKDNVSDEPVFIDGNTLDLYIKDANTGKYQYFEECTNIFLKGSQDLSYEKRINENGFYEFKFGNGVFGKKINEGDQILIYYLKSDGESGAVSTGTLDGNQINYFTTPQFLNISDDIYGANVTFLPVSNLLDLNFTNTVGSTQSREKENVDEIRINSVKLFQSQDRLVTINDYDSFINKNFSSIVKSIKVVNNKEYTNQYIKYFYDLGLDRPNDDSRFLFNQVKFPTQGQFNNLYFFFVPKINPVGLDNSINFLSTSQKNSIFESMSENKQANIEFSSQDPVYNAFSVGLRESSDEVLNKDLIDETLLVIKRKTSERISVERIAQEVNNIFKNYFDSATLGYEINLENLSQQILTVEGVDSIITRRTSKNGVTESPGINLISFNTIYDTQDIEIISSSFTLPFFKYPFLFNGTLKNNILVEDV